MSNVEASQKVNFPSRTLREVRGEATKEDRLFLEAHPMEWGDELKALLDEVETHAATKRNILRQAEYALQEAENAHTECLVSYDAAIDDGDHEYAGSLKPKLERLHREYVQCLSNFSAERANIAEWRMKSNRYKAAIKERLRLAKRLRAESKT